MSALKQRVKGLIRPFYRLATYPARVAIRRLRSTLQIDLGPLHHSLQQSRDAVLRYLEENDRAVVGLVKGLHQSAARPRDIWAVPIGPGRVLAPHPSLPFMYLHADDLDLTPRVLLGQWGMALQALWPRLVKPGWSVIEAGAGQGLHTLTLARLVGPSGRVVTYEPVPCFAPVLTQNLRTHRLNERVIAQQGPFDLSSALGLLGSCPDLLCLDADAVKASLGGLGELLGGERPPLLVLRAGTDGAEWPGEVMSRLVKVGLRMWQVGPEGQLWPVGPRSGNGACLASDLLAARSLE